MPITENVVQICHEGATPDQLLQDLLSREVRAEFEGVIATLGHPMDP
jgi:hypothetical protein